MAVSSDHENEQHTWTDAVRRPILTPKTVLPLFFLVGLIFAPIGGLLLYASDKVMEFLQYIQQPTTYTSMQVQELAIDYSNCASGATETFEPMDTGRISSHFSSSNTGVNAEWRRQNISVNYGPNYNYETTQCQIRFTVPNAMGSPVFLYYRLTKFYQNHRRYVKSLDQDQLTGTFRSNSSISGSYCDPLTLDENGKAYYPCGLIANSMFNDTIYAPVLLDVAGSSASNRTYNMTNTGIAWSSDSSLYGKTAYTYDQVVPPPNWRVKYPAYNATYPIPDLGSDEEFQVWMRTAGLPTFSKLALRNDNETMIGGTYQININDCE